MREGGEGVGGREGGGEGVGGWRRRWGEGSCAGDGLYHLSLLCSGHLAKGYADSLVTEDELSLPPKTSPGVRTKAGYMWYAEPKTFGIHWIRLYFYIKNSMLLSEVCGCGQGSKVRYRYVLFLSVNCQSQSSYIIEP